MADEKKQTVYIKGMHCASCDILIHDKFKELKNVKNVTANHVDQTAEITYTGSLDKKQLDEKISQFGYNVTDRQGILRENEPLSKRLYDVGIIAVILSVIYYFANELNLIPQFNSPDISLGSAVLLGVIASLSTCMATSGALFLATVGKLQSSKFSLKKNLIPAVTFNTGRVLSYAFFGFLTGLFGQVLTGANAQVSTWFNLVIAVLLVFIALDMLRLVRFSSIANFSFKKRLFEAIQQRLLKHPRRTAFFLGAITYLLPCGFTQTVQLYALSLADPKQGALLMGLFAIGTVPLLMFMGFASSFSRSQYYPVFMRVIGVIVLFVGFQYFLNSLTLLGVKVNPLSAIFGSKTNQQPIDKNVVLENGFQVASMSVNSTGYYPKSFTVKKNVPVKWVVNGENVIGCQGQIVAPKINVQKTLSKGKNVIEFTPKEKGEIAFSCSMGMFEGTFYVM